MTAAANSPELDPGSVLAAELVEAVVDNTRTWLVEGEPARRAARHAHI